MSAPTPTIRLKYGMPGLLATSGIALLAISVFKPTLLPVGISLLLLGILYFIVKRAVHAVQVL